MKKKMMLLLMVVALVVCMTMALVGCASTDVKDIDEMAEKIANAKSITFTMTTKATMLGTEKTMESVAKYNEKAYYANSVGGEEYTEIVDDKYDTYTKEKDNEWVFYETVPKNPNGFVDKGMIDSALGEGLLKSDMFTYDKKVKGFVLKDMTKLSGVFQMFANDKASFKLVIKGGKIEITANIDADGMKADVVMSIDKINSTSIARPDGLPKKA